MTATAIRHHILDDVARWADEATFVRPDFDVAKFQKRLDDVAGLSRNGKSIVVLRWMRSRECSEEYYTEWDWLGKPVKGELRAKYRAFGVDLGNGDVCEIPPPRWCLEQRYEPEQYAPTWEADRYTTDTVTGLRVPVRPPAPRDGYYSHLWTIASHEGKCCDDALKNNMVCWGSYRLPGEQDLQALRIAIARREADSVKGNPYGDVPYDSLKELARRNRDDRQETEKKTKELTREALSDALRPHLHRYTEDPSVLAHGKYHFVDKRKWKNLSADAEKTKKDK